MPGPRMVAVALRSSQRLGTGKASRVAGTPASLNLASAQVTPFRLAAEPVARPPTSSVSCSRSRIIGVSPSSAAISREISSDCWARRGETSPASASATRTAWLLAHIHRPSLHHELDPFHRAEVLLRVAVYGDQVREGAGLDHAELSFHPQ